MSGEPHVAVIVADHPEALGDQRVLQFGRPTRHLRAQTHDQQDRFGAGVALAFVLDGDPVGFDLRHDVLRGGPRALAGGGDEALTIDRRKPRRFQAGRKS
jgi:hypothetical protein